MTTSGPARHLNAAPEPVLPREHADRVTYQEWVEQHCTSYASRWDRMKNYDRFVEQWPVLQDWFDAPLRQRLLDKENCVRGQHPHGGASVIMPYLTYLSLVHGVGLDYPVLLARTFTSPFKLQTRHGGLGVDAGLFDRHVARLTELGYATARTQLVSARPDALAPRRPGPDGARRGRPRRTARRDRRLHRPTAAGPGP